MSFCRRYLWSYHQLVFSKSARQLQHGENARKSISLLVYGEAQIEMEEIYYALAKESQQDLPTVIHRRRALLAFCILFCCGCRTGFQESILRAEMALPQYSHLPLVPARSLVVPLHFSQITLTKLDLLPDLPERITQGSPPIWSVQSQNRPCWKSHSS